MTQNATSGRSPYRRAYVGLWLLAGVLFAAIVGFGYELRAVGAFALADRFDRRIEDVLDRDG